MSDAGETARPNRRLAEAIREVKNAAADRTDVVVDLREASRARLELLAVELAPLFSEVPADIDLFDFTISSGLQPRLWIDAVSHVAMGRDRRTYRFLRDTRVGRVVIVEDSSVKPVADHVARYVAERLVERQKLMEGFPEPAVPGMTRRNLVEAEEPLRWNSPTGWYALLQGAGLFVAGAIVGFALSAALWWDRLTGG